MKEKTSWKALFIAKQPMDEMQKQTMLRIDHNGAWLVIVGLVASIAIQGLMGAGLKQVAGEFVVFLLMAGYELVAYLRAGIWCEWLKAGWATNLAAACLVGAVLLIYAMLLHSNLVYALRAAGYGGGLCFVLAQLSTVIYKSRHKALEDPDEEEATGHRMPPTIDETEEKKTDGK